MAYSTGLLKDRVTVQNRTKAQRGKFGLDSTGVEYEDVGSYWASVDYARGKQAMNAGSLDVYAVVMVRMRWNSEINLRSRIVHNGQTYQILGDTFHASRQDNTIQFHAQVIVEQ